VQEGKPFLLIENQTTIPGRPRLPITGVHCLNHSKINYLARRKLASNQSMKPRAEEPGLICIDDETVVSRSLLVPVVVAAEDILRFCPVIL
jgi:hypothetical protein